MTFESPTNAPASIRAQGVEKLTAVVTNGVVVYLAALVAAYAAQVDEAYRAVEGLRLTADANALQDAVEALEKLGWMLAAHTVTE